MLPSQGISRGETGETVVALLGAFVFERGHAWKRYEFAVMEAPLREKGYVSDPYGRVESIYLTESGMTRAKQLPKANFCAARQGLAERGRVRGVKSHKKLRTHCRAIGESGQLH